MNRIQQTQTSINLESVIIHALYGGMPGTRKAEKSLRLCAASSASGARRGHPYSEA